MKNIVILIGLVLTFGFTHAQSNREDLAIRWPTADGWVLDEKSSAQTNFSRRHQRWHPEHDSKADWKKTVMIFQDDLTKNAGSLDSISIYPDVSNTDGPGFNILKEKKSHPFPYKLISIENQKTKPGQPPISTLAYITDGKTCRHTVIVSVKTSKFPAGFLKQWSEILLNSRIIPSKAGNFEYTDDAALDIKAINGSNTFLVTASFKQAQLHHLVKGQSVKIVLDELPEMSLSGKITAISDLKNNAPLVSPNTASGNYVKMTESFPVIINTEIPSAIKDKLRSGMRCTVTVATAP